MIEEYVIDCIKNNKKVSGRKVSKFKHLLNYSTLYCKAKNINHPKCKECNLPAKFISLKVGFGKFCGMACHSAALGKNNTRNNAAFNLEKSEQNKKQNINKYIHLIPICQTEYMNSNITINELSKKYNINKGFLKAQFKINGISTKFKQTDIFRRNLNKKFLHVNNKLNDKNWLKEKIDAGYTSKNLSTELGCSPNYICSYIRNKHDNIQLNNYNSSYELIISKIFDELGLDYKRNDRKIISPLELDIYLRDFNLAIEVNGVYWHNSERKEKNYHLNKTIMCAESNVRLLHFTDIEIDENLDKIKSIIQSATGNARKIYARKCTVNEIDIATYRKFCNDNHIQGYASASIKMGLFLDNNLVSIMSFGKSRFNKNYEYELIRYCCILDHVVVGGPSKLFKSFIKKYKPNTMISYCQRRIFTGNMYNKIGMTFSHNTPPNYSWIGRDKVLSRYKTQRHKLSGDKNLSESDIMTKAGFYKIYDCGQSVFIWNNK